MQRLYEKIAKELENTLVKYMEGEASLDELLEVQRKENLLLDCKNWEIMRRKLKNSVFELSMKLFAEINECQRLLDIYEKYRKCESGSSITVNDVNNSNDISECNKEGASLSEESLISHALVLARNRMAPPGFEHSNWYLGPFPSNQNIEALNTEEKDKVN